MDKKKETLENHKKHKDFDRRIAKIIVTSGKSEYSDAELEVIIQDVKNRINPKMNDAL